MVWMLQFDTWVRLYARLLAMHSKFNWMSMEEIHRHFKLIPKGEEKILSLIKSLAKECERGIFLKISAFKKLELTWELPNVMDHGPSTRPLGLYTTMIQTPPTKYFNIFLQCQNLAPRHSLVFHGVRPLGRV